MAAIIKNRDMATKISTVEARALILGLIIPIVGSIFHFMMVAMVSYGSPYQNRTDHTYCWVNLSFHDGNHSELWQPLPKNKDMATKSQLLRLEI